jgi:hypothetical protein
MRIIGWKWHRKSTALAAFGILLLSGVVSVKAQDKPYPELDQQLQLLKNQFNADVGKVRLLVILDPTCPVCRRGGTIIQKNVMERFATDKLVAYIVWVPVLNFQDPVRLQRNAQRYTSILPPGPRVAYYSDPGADTGKKYSPIIGEPYGVPAWDVYFAFGADARWGDTPPTPSFWQEQSGGGFAGDRTLDGPRFAEEVHKLLAKIGQ